MLRIRQALPCLLEKLLNILPTAAAVGPKSLLEQRVLLWYEQLAAVWCHFGWHYSTRPHDLGAIQFQGVLELEEWTPNRTQLWGRFWIPSCALEPCKRVLGRIFIVSQFHHHFVRGTVIQPTPQQQWWVASHLMAIIGRFCDGVASRPSSPFVMTR